MKIRTFEGGLDKNFTYLVTGGDSPQSVIIDAAVPVEHLIQSVENNRLTPVSLLITHTHHDHIVYLREYQQAFPNIKVHLWRHNNHYLNQQNLSHLDKIHVGSLKFTVIHTPGHTPDSVCYLVESKLFTGDTLFVGRTGRTIGVTSDTRQLYRSVYSKILTLPGNTVIYPGHNYGNVQTIILEENIKISPLLRATDEDDFVKRMKEYEQSRRKLY